VDGNGSGFAQGSSPARRGVAGTFSAALSAVFSGGFAGALATGDVPAPAQAARVKDVAAKAARRGMGFNEISRDSM